MSLRVTRLAPAVQGLATLLSLAALSLSVPAWAADPITSAAAGSPTQAFAPSRQVEPLPGMRLLNEPSHHQDDESRALMACLEVPERPSQPLAGEERLRARLISVDLAFSGEHSTPSTLVTFSEVAQPFEASVLALLKQAKAACARPLQREQHVFVEVLHDPVSGKAEWRPLKLLGVSSVQHPVCAQEPNEEAEGNRSAMSLESLTLELAFPPGRDTRPSVRVIAGTPSEYGLRFAKEIAEDMRLTCAGPRKGNLYFERTFNFFPAGMKFSGERGAYDRPREVAFADWWVALTDETAQAWVDTTGLGCPLRVRWRQMVSNASNEFEWVGPTPPKSAQRKLLVEWLSKAKIRMRTADNELAVTNHWLMFDVPCGQLG